MSVPDSPAKSKKQKYLEYLQRRKQRLKKRNLGYQYKKKKVTATRQPVRGEDVGKKPKSIDRPLPNFEAFQQTDQIQSRAYAEHLESQYWKMIRTYLLKAHRYTCALCLVQHGPQTLSIHHMSYAHVGAEHEHLEELLVVCRSCHGAIHRWSNPDLVALDPYRNKGRVPSHDWIKQHLSAQKKIKKVRKSKDKFTPMHAQSLDTCIGNLFG